LQSNATWAFNPDHVLSDFHNTLKSKKSCKDPALTTFNGNKGNATSIDLFSREDALSRMITKQDFPNMKVIGQFNLGFMICELRGDMYILDQHACDEKYRFETLQQTTSIHQQPLISPLTVETNAAEEIIIMENLKIFEANGFKLRICEDEPPGSRIKLLSVPLSKSVQFNTDDVHELASFLSDESSGYLTKLILKNDINPNLGNSKGDKNMIRLPKLAAMFASRACRSAVMIGTALSNSEMRGIVDRLATIDQPWNCPHGRPTMRHLFDLSSYYEGQKQLPY
jgi:DNA mismatch repair protein PMS2